jgi:hypothetical protein
MIILSSKSNHTSNLICIFLYSITTQTLSEKKKTSYTEDIQTINKQTQKFCFYFLSFQGRIGMPNPAVIFMEAESCQLSMFGSVVAITFQIIFHAKIHANDIFFIF